MIFMKKNYFLFTLSICMSLQTSILECKAKKEKLSWEGPAPLSMFKKVRTPEELSSQEISALSTALASTQANAGTNALNMLTEIAQNKKHLLEAIYVICKGLTTPDTARNNATPISLATAAVKKTLSTGIIESLNEEYDLTLLHYATLFSVFGGVLKPSPDIKTSATTIINSILTGLTNNEQLAATMAEDMWNSTPVHYALLAPEATQLGVINAIMPTTNIKNSVLSKKISTTIHQHTTLQFLSQIKKQSLKQYSVD